MTRSRFLTTLAGALAAPFAARALAATPATPASTPQPATVFGPIQTHTYVNVEFYLNENGRGCLDYTRADLHVDRFRMTDQESVETGAGTRYKWKVKRLMSDGSLMEVADFHASYNVSRDLSPPEITASWREPISTTSLT